MESIVFEVDDSAAKAWKNSSPDVRMEYEAKIAELLRNLKVAEFNGLLGRAGKIAEDNGLTEEKLNEILNDRD